MTPGHIAQQAAVTCPISTQQRSRVPAVVDVRFCVVLVCRSFAVCTVVSGPQALSVKKQDICYADRFCHNPGLEMETLVIFTRPAFHAKNNCAPTHHTTQIALKHHPSETPLALPVPSSCGE